MTQYLYYSITPLLMWLLPYLYYSITYDSPIAHIPSLLMWLHYLHYSITDDDSITDSLLSSSLMIPPLLTLLHYLVLLHITTRQGTCRLLLVTVIIIVCSTVVTQQSGLPALLMTLWLNIPPSPIFPPLLLYLHYSTTPWLHDSTFHHHLFLPQYIWFLQYSISPLLHYSMTYDYTRNTCVHTRQRCARRCAKTWWSHWCCVRLAPHCGIL